MNLKDLKLRTKLGVGFGLIILMAAIGGFISNYQLSNLNQETNDFATSTILESNMHTARYAALMLQQTQENIYKDIHEESLEELYAQLESIKESISNQQYEQLRLNIRQYERAFIKENAAAKTRDSLMSEMREVAEQVLVTSDAIGNEQNLKLRIVQNFLSARKYEKEIIIDKINRKEYTELYNSHIETALNTAERFKNRLVGTTYQEASENLHKRIPAYKEAAEAYFEQIDLQEQYLTVENKNSDELLEIIQTLEGQQLEHMNKQQTTAVIVSGIFLVLVIALGVFLAIFISGIISKPIMKAVEFAKKVAAGNYSAQIKVAGKDESGQLAQALQEMLDSFKEGVAYAEKIAKGDLSNTETQVNANQNPLEKALRLMETKLTEVIANIKTGTESIASGSREISASSSQVASGANEQAASTEEVSASMEEMAANINQSTENAKITEKIAAKSAVGIKKGNNSFKITVEAMREIAGKIKMISEIARKTDVLAINAAIEAARAGEHGKGFAVVANEIRKLAENSQEAATVIEDVVGSSVDVAEESDKILSALLPEVERTSALVKEITNAGNEQNSGVNQINNAVQELTKVIQENTSAADEMASGAKSMALQARELEKIVAFFKIDEFTKQTAEKTDVEENFEEIAKEINEDENEDDTKDKKGSSINLDDYDDKDDDEFETYK